MAVSSGPKITKDGLVLYLDAANFESFRGEPTTNLAALPKNINYGYSSTISTRTNDQLKNFDGTMTAALISGTGWLAKISVSATNGNRYTTSWYVKAGTNTSATFGWGGAHNGNRTNITFNLITGNVTSLSLASGENYGVDDLKNGWWRVWYSSTLSTGGGYYPQLNNGNGSMYVGAIQIEEKSYATAFVEGSRGTTVATGGGWADMTNNGNHGELINGVSYDSGSLGALSFDGVNDRIEINNNELARIGTGNHTIMAWVNNDIVTEEDFIGTGGISTGNVLLMIYSQAGGGSGGFRGHAWGSTGNSNTLDSPRAIGTGNWNLLVQRVEWGGNIDLFENGIKTATKILVGSAPSSSASKFIIGARSTSTGNSHFDGKISNVMVFNRALTDSEIKQIYEATRARYGL